MRVANAPDGKRSRVDPSIGKPRWPRGSPVTSWEGPHICSWKKEIQFMKGRRLLVMCLMARRQAEQGGVHVLPSAEGGARRRQHPGPRA